MTRKEHELHRIVQSYALKYIGKMVKKWNRMLPCSGEQCGTQASCFMINVLSFHFSEVERNLIKQMVQFTQSHRSTSVLQRRKLSRRTMIKVRVHKLYIVFFFRTLKWMRLLEHVFLWIFSVNIYVLTILFINLNIQARNIA